MNRTRVALALCSVCGLVGVLLLLALPATVTYRYDHDDAYRCSAVLDVPPHGDAYPDLYEKMDQDPERANTDFEDDHRRLKDDTGADKVANYCARYRDRRLGLAIFISVPTCLFGAAAVGRTRR